jgi:MoaA/NifB/PqqE/SkfB family radical SAM enzyme
MANLKDKLNLLRGLIDGAKAYDGPVWAGLDVTTRCNINCIGCFYHCLQGREPKKRNNIQADISLNLVQKICHDLCLLGTHKVILSGEGEPLLHPNIEQIITTFKSGKFKVKLLTNGTLLTRRKVATIVEAGLDELLISFWAVNHDEHIKCHPGINLDLMEKRIEGIRLLNELKKINNKHLPRIQLHMIINKHNFKNITQRVELAEQSGCNSLSFGVFRDYGGRFQQLALNSQDIAEVKDKLHQTKKIFASKAIQFHLEDYLPHALLGYQAAMRSPCYAGWYQTFIKVNGDVWLCPHCTRSVGNIQGQNFHDIWNSAGLQNFRRKGLTSGTLNTFGPECDCANCCLISNNLKVHRFFKWLKPILDKQ